MKRVQSSAYIFPCISLVIDCFVYICVESVETRNALTSELGGYEHVVVLRDFNVVDGNLIDCLKQLPRGTVPGDCILYFPTVPCGTW